MRPFSFINWITSDELPWKIFLLTDHYLLSSLVLISDSTIQLGDARWFVPFYSKIRSFVHPLNCLFSTVRRYSLHQWRNRNICNTPTHTTQSLLHTLRRINNSNIYIYRRTFSFCPIKYVSPRKFGIYVIYVIFHNYTKLTT